MSRFTDLQTEFHATLEKLKDDYERGTVDRAAFDRLHIWHEFLKTKIDAEREINAKDITPLSFDDE